MIYEIFGELRESNSRLHKEAVFQKHRDNEIFKRVCYMTYNPMISFYIRKVPFDWNINNNNENTVPLEDALELMEQLACRKFTGNQAIDMVKEMGESLSPGDAHVLTKIIERDLEIGCSEGTVNKTWNKLIPDYPVMLALPDKEKNRSTIKFPAIAQIKMDGTRINAVVTQYSIEYFTRNGRLASIGNSALSEELSAIWYEIGDFILDGEALCIDSDGEFLDRKTGNGWINRAIKKPESLTEEQINSFAIVAWDIIDVGEFKAEKSNRPYVERFSLLERVIRPDFNHIRSVFSEVVDTWEQAEHFYGLALNSGQEGLIIKNTDLLWENKRPKGCVKMKAELDADLLVTGVQEGTGKYAGMIGSLVCESAGDNKIVVNVGSGMSDADRKKDPSEYIDKIVAVVYNEIIKSRVDDKPRSLFLPIFKEVRLDKDFPDTL